MAVLNLLGLAGDVTVPGGLWQWLILTVFDFVTDYGWRIVLFTLILKVALSPLDIIQRRAMHKNQRITERMKPDIEKLERQYASNPAELQAKKSELNKRAGVKMAAGCLPMLITTVISIWLLMGGLNPISQYKNMVQYLKLYDAYTAAEFDSYARENEAGENNPDGLEYYKIGKNEAGEIISVALNTEIFKIEIVTEEGSDPEPEARYDYDAMNEYEAGAIARATEIALNACETAYFSEIQESFLWVKNIWVTDAPWAKPVMSEQDFKNAVGGFAKDPKSMGLDISAEEYEHKVMGSYEKITARLYASPENRTNGILVLPICSILTMFASQFLTRRLQKKSGQDTGGAGGAVATNKITAYMMPVIFGIFALFFTTAFSLYMITNSIIMMLISLGTGLILNRSDKKERQQQLTDDGIVRYGRPDPNAKPADRADKKK